MDFPLTCYRVVAIQSGQEGEFLRVGSEFLRVGSEFLRVGSEFLRVGPEHMNMDGNLSEHQN